MPRGYAHFTLELDTTPPQVSITAPHITVPGIYVEINVIANEDLDQWQEVYVIDSAGTRHDLTFQHQGDRLYGLYDFWNCEIGIATIYARVRDEVHNQSILTSHTIEIASEAPVSRLIGEYRIATIDEDPELTGGLIIKHDSEQGLVGTYSSEPTHTIDLVGEELIIKKDEESESGLTGVFPSEPTHSIKLNGKIILKPIE